jgi:glutamine amidotransferase
MNVTIVDYNSGNISSVINSFKEVAQNKVNIEVTSDLEKIKSSDKVVLPGQGSFKSCVEAYIFLVCYLFLKPHQRSNLNL